MKYNLNKLKEFINNELSKVKFNQSTKGFKYLEEAIFICVINDDAIDNLSKNVFPKIANEHNEKTSFNVKWCIEQIINTMYNNTDGNILCQNYNLEINSKSTLKHIIYTILCKCYRHKNELRT